MQDFRQLHVWRKAHDLTVAVYKASAHFPRSELYGIIGQMRRACASVPTNIAEGSAMRSDREFARFLAMAMGSASELEYLLLLAKDLEYLDRDEFEALTKETVSVKRMLSSLMGKLKARER